MSIASVAAQQSSAATSTTPTAAATAAASSSSAAAVSTNALSSLTGNFNDFLSLLMTQLKNQDPSSPLDTNQFTTELVQFAGVAQQINTNTDLTQLVSLTQAGQILQSSAIVGKQVLVQSPQMPLQSGVGHLQFTSTKAATTDITVTDASGGKVLATSVAATSGTNDWNWNGHNTAGSQMADGAYTVTVTQPSADGTTTTAVPFNVIGTATGVQKNGATVQLQLGAETVDFSAVQSVL